MTFLKNIHLHLLVVLTLLLEMHVFFAHSSGPVTMDSPGATSLPSIIHTAFRETKTMIKSAAEMFRIFK